jgi:hypothetical protein
MLNEDKTIEKLLKELSEVNKQTEYQENDAAYDITPNEFSIDQYGNMISKDKSSDVIY